MKKPSRIAEMIAKNAFNSPRFQQAWQTHMQAFGPILAPAYADCYTAKIHITNILNKLSRQDAEGAGEVLVTLVRSCGCAAPADKALVSFLQGFCHEIAGDRMKMFAYYSEAGNHGHSFYLPHLKCARFAHDAGQLDIALTEYFKGLRCIQALPEDASRARLLGSTLTNAASCLTWMHRYQDAENMLKEARQTGAVPRIEAVEAVLFAAQEKGEEADACLAALAAANDPDCAHIRELTQSILEHRDPHFHPQPLNEEAIADFWAWFAQNEVSLRALYDQRDEQLPEEFLDLLSERIAPCFPFKHDPPEIGCGGDDGPAELTLFSGYSRALTAGLLALVEACPADLAHRWYFNVER